ncbi:hypothetical protein [Pontibacter amylolyticus]|uniref:Lipoprotein n=1 Tax=Pontibacter amylolyticus TaxID=1424080 RepID=A0ABQ1WHK1_9BACT|nr:hypothetical protein [Pontibacter amylolyticus]GGG28618.1 hypothetical protein GCM10011323_35010 [Pontibacter amylolyticus]
MFITGCGPQDDFYTVTKIVDIQDTIFVNKPFDFKLVLRNDSLNEMKFTIDDTVQKSVSFNLFFSCNDQLLRSDVENPKNLKHDYQEYFLKKGDSLTYRFTGLLRQVNNNLQMEIEGYERIYKIENSPCDRLTIDFGGMWIPGDFNPLDAMEGYNFRKIIFVSLDTAKTDLSRNQKKNAL